MRGVVGVFPSRPIDIRCSERPIGHDTRRAGGINIAQLQGDMPTIGLLRLLYD
jgi:hypothetical protein